MRRISRWLAAAFTAVAILAADAGASPDPLLPIHEALFATFIPLDKAEITPEVRQSFLSVREGIWSAAAGDAHFRALLTPFSGLNRLAPECRSAPLASASFADLTARQREDFLFSLESCSSNDARRLAMTVRNFYIAKTYGALQEPLTGVKLNLYAPQSFIEAHRPHLPPTRLSYHPQQKEIALTGAAIDYLIVGSGPAGAVLAHELRRGGRRVVLIDRGSFTVPGAAQTRLIDDFVDSRTSADGGIYIRNGMAVGGGSLVNVDLCFAPTLPSVQARIAAWRSEGRIGQDDFTLAKISKAYEWVKSSIGTRTLSESEINANNRVLWDGAELAGLHPKLYALNTWPPGTSPSPVTDKRSAASELILKALVDGENPLSLIPDADVRRVLFDKTSGEWRATGVEVRIRRPSTDPSVIADPNGFGISPGGAVTIRARNVILCAGALGSATILLRSHVPNDQIGRGVILHPSMPVLGLFDHTIDALDGTQASVFVDDFLVSNGFALEAMSAEPLYAAVMAPGPALHSFQVLMSYRKLAGFGVMLVDTPSAQNRLLLHDDEPLIEYDLSEPDKRRFRTGVALALRVMLLAGAKRVYLPTTENILAAPGSEPHTAVFTSLEQVHAAAERLQFIPNTTILTSAHMQATNKMGSDPRTSVVATDFHVWGTRQLYVVDSSVFPTSIGANPMQSIYTFAKLFSDRITAQ